MLCILYILYSGRKIGVLLSSKDLPYFLLTCALGIKRARAQVGEKVPLILHKALVCLLP